MDAEPAVAAVVVLASLALLWAGLTWLAAAFTPPPSGDHEYR